MGDIPDFKFLDPGVLIDGELELKVARQFPPEPSKGWVAAYFFEMWAAGSADAAGRMSFRAQSNRLMELYRGHVGYDVHPAHRGRHFAERSVRLVLPFVRRHGFSEIWLTCDPDNMASRRTCERLGATFVETVAVPETEEMYARGHRTKCRYRLDL